MGIRLRISENEAYLLFFTQVAHVHTQGLAHIGVVHFFEDSTVVKLEIIAEPQLLRKLRHDLRIGLALVKRIDSLLAVVQRGALTRIRNLLQFEPLGDGKHHVGVACGIGHDRIRHHDVFHSRNNDIGPRMRVGVGVQRIGRIHPQHFDLRGLAAELAGFHHVLQVDAGNGKTRAGTVGGSIRGIDPHMDAPERTVRSSRLAQIAQQGAKGKTRHRGMAAVVVRLGTIAFIVVHRGVHADFGQLVNVIDRYFGKLRNLLGRMIEDLLFQQRIRRATLHTVELVRSFDVGRRRFVDRNEFAVRENHVRIVHDLLARGRIHHAGGNRGDAGVASAHEHARIAAHQERCDGMLLQIRHILRVLFQNHVHESVLQQRVATGANGNPPVGF